MLIFKGNILFKICFIYIEEDYYKVLKAAIDVCELTTSDLIRHVWTVRGAVTDELTSHTVTVPTLELVRLTLGLGQLA